MRTLGKVLFGLSFAGLLACAGAWFVLLANICSNPHTPNTATQNTIPYSCHGTIVFLTPIQQLLLEWLGPIGVFFMLASFILLAWVLHMRRIHAVQQR